MNQKTYNNLVYTGPRLQSPASPITAQTPIDWRLLAQSNITYHILNIQFRYLTVAGEFIPIEHISIIPLTQAKFTIVDPDNYEWLQQYRWYTNRVGKNFYAETKIRVDGKRRTVSMHRLIMDPPWPYQVDHRNRFGLDNRCSNLRICTGSENLGNIGLDPRNKSGYKGVSYFKRYGTWRAAIQYQNRWFHIGYFKTARQAALAYDKKARELFHEFANTNF